MTEQANKHANGFFNDFGKSLLQDTNVCKLGKVVNFYSDQMKVDVLPMPSEDNSMIINVPVATVRSKDFVFYYPLEAGDLVVLLFVDNDTDNILLGQDSAETERVHDISDCICLGGITLLKDSLGLAQKDAAVLQTTSGSGKITLGKDGSIKLEGPKIDLIGHASYNGKEIACKGDGTSDGASIV